MHTLALAADLYLTVKVKLRQKVWT